MCQQLQHGADVAGRMCGAGVIEPSWLLSPACELTNSVGASSPFARFASRKIHWLGQPMDEHVLHVKGR